LSAAIHGWKFDCHSGQCVGFLPLRREQGRSCEWTAFTPAATLAKEHDGFIWVFMPEPVPGRGIYARGGADGACAACADIYDKYKTAYLGRRSRLQIDHGIIGLMDPAHGRFRSTPVDAARTTSIHEQKKKRPVRRSINPMMP